MSPEPSEDAPGRVIAAHAVDAAAGRGLDPTLLGELEGLANRGYTDGFYQRHTPAATQNYLRGHSESGRSLYVGDVLGYDDRGFAEIEVKNRFALGDRLEIVHPRGNRQHRVEIMLDRAGAPIACAAGSGHRVRLPLPPMLEGAFLARYLH